MIDYLCIGAHKSGTSWLHGQLIGHPQIWSPIYKELHFFDEYEKRNGLISETNKRRVWLKNYLLAQAEKVDSGGKINSSVFNWVINFVQTPFHQRDIAWYLNLFSEGRESGKVIGETTPSYALLSENTFKEIFNINNQIKIIFIMRNPIWRAWSSVRFDLRTEKKLTNNSRTNILSHNVVKDYLDREPIRRRGDYIATLTKLRNVFPADAVKYLFYEDINENPLKLLSEVCSHLQIDFNKDYFLKIQNRTLPSVNADIDEYTYNFLKEMYTPMVKEINNNFIRVHSSWANDFTCLL